MKILLGLLAFFTVVSTTKGFAQTAASRQDSIAMAKTIDSLKKEILKKDKKVISLKSAVKTLTSIAFSTDSDVVNSLRNRGYLVIGPDEDLSNYTYNKWRCGSMIIAIQYGQ